MENKNRLFTILWVLLAMAAGGVALTFSFNHSVRSAVEPIAGSLREITEGQKRMESASKALDARLAALESEVKLMKVRLEALGGPPPEDMNKVYDLPVAGSYVLGPKNAPVTITVFQDYQCAFCARFYPTALDARKAFPDQVRMIVKHYPLPFHSMARPAAKAAMAAGEQGRFYEMSSLLLANAETLSADKFKELAKEAGLNGEQFLKDLKDKDAAYEKILDADLELGSKADVRGTPTFFLNGKKSDARTADAWKAAIQSVLKK